MNMDMNIPNRSRWLQYLCCMEKGKAARGKNRAIYYLLFLFIFYDHNHEATKVLYRL